MNKGTDEAIIKEFMEESIKDKSGVLPAKTIIFAISKKHAQGLLDAFNRLYPEHKGEIAETIYSGMERPDKLIDKFMKKDLPRVAISIDMLDTGLDVPEICNLVFAKPVFSSSFITSKLSNSSSNPLIESSVLALSTTITRVGFSV